MSMKRVVGIMKHHIVGCLSWLHIKSVASIVVALILIVILFTPRICWAGEDPQPSWWETAILNALQIFWEWLSNSIKAMIETGLGYLLEMIPADWQANIEPMKVWAEVANAWVPLDYGLTLLAVYYTFLAVFVTVKFILKLIPTVG